jgi:hypothetical protein
MGQGISVLFHIPAEASWSNLPISGLFVEMLQKILQLSRGDHTTITPNDNLLPLHILDAFAENTTKHSALPLTAGDTTIKISPQHPPGLYGTDSNNIALNLGSDIGQPEALRGIATETYTTTQQQIDLQPYLLLATFLLVLGDFLLSLRMRGFLKLAVLLLCCFNYSANAANDVGVELTSKTYLAYVQTGDAAIDRTSELGLRGLAAMIQDRTSIDSMGVARIDPNVDDLAYFPLLYWPIAVGQNSLSAEGAKRVTHYLRHGGMILFDAVNGEDVAPTFLQHILAGVDLPPLERLPDNHVLKRSFYRLDDFPGRFTGHDFWLEPEAASPTDGVASVLYGSNGWSGAWAMDAKGQAQFPCTPGGDVQRERAFRFGINLVMYALTGNYKNDQLQTTTLLKKMDR